MAGTEEGIKEPQATFSACFGAAFIMLHPTKYAAMLAEKMQAHGATGWLVNTGWSGGRYDILLMLERFPNAKYWIGPALQNKKNVSTSRDGTRNSYRIRLTDQGHGTSLQFWAHFLFNQTTLVRNFLKDGGHGPWGSHCRSIPQERACR